MATLRLYFLGTLDIRYDDQPLHKLATLKSQSLLAYLILHRHQPQPRDRLAGLFWGDRPERKARHSLATALWHIRRCLPAEEPALSPSASLGINSAEGPALSSAERSRYVAEFILSLSKGSRSTGAGLVPFSMLPQFLYAP